MAHVSTISLSDVLRAWFGRTLSAMTKAYDTYVDLASRRHAIAALEALSDAELAERGLSRAEIVPFVFRDRMSY